MTAPRRPKDVQQWLAQQPSLGELREAFPADWEAVDAELGPLVERGDLEEIKAYVRDLAKPSAPALAAARRRERQDALVSAQVRRQMAVAALRPLLRASVTGAPAGRLRFNLLNGWVAQK